MFEKFPSLTRFSHGWTITEKLDGTNAQILIVPNGDVTNDAWVNGLVLGSMAGEGEWKDHLSILAGSRSKMLTATKQGDNHGFARFVADHASELIAVLGVGRHFGEWVGKGVNKRHYGLDEKVFALFNVHRWADVELPPRLRVVPVLFEGYADNPGAEAAAALTNLRAQGSAFAPGYDNPEGIVMRHGPSGTLFKKTFDYDEQGKWAENQEARRLASECAAA
jgi:hypothetical protein